MTDKELKKQINDKGSTGKIYLNDGSGLFLRFASGHPYWTYRYPNPITGRPTQKSFGVYPTVTMAAAKRELTKFKADLLQGNSPQAQREAVRQHASACF